MQTIGERLEEARKRRGVTIREAADATKIRGDYLQKFESNQFDIGLMDIYVRGFLRGYAIYLHLPPDRILNDFAALGGGDVRPRQPSREVYGRMDLSVSSSEERANERAGAAQAEPQPEESPARPSPQVTRTRPSTMQTGPLVSPELVFKGGIALGLLLAVLLLIWIVKAIFGGESPRAAVERAAPPPPVVQPAAEATFTLVALDAVQVQVNAVSDNRLLYQGSLVRGQTAAVPKPGPVYIIASAGENLAVEISGKRYPMPFKGRDRAKLP